MSYDEEEINDSGFNPNEEGLDDEPFFNDDEPLEDEEMQGFRFDEEEEPEGI